MELCPERRVSKRPESVDNEQFTRRAQADNRANRPGCRLSFTPSTSFCSSAANTKGVEKRCKEEHKARVVMKLKPGWLTACRRKRTNEEYMNKPAPMMPTF
ncbi:hypothetical protein I7I53_06670 [Histoplasma capsulatum var. duboisii H88]|uniref:Uncharacterized protein n=1 Tax=Ajellomyces capsulatus (strain H88) TaxID=544711 RepID=A0A8A1LFZ0_AJEC8|nr:hypothetical protein I7I53_06670 [Histoplasma capsulatum var. duboisii H88]